ncbi:MAG: hypothetical protein K0S46_1975 [Moraxellaceae bacterium]|jgi:uncharacterized protein (TIGR00251 family)|nr:hypothetical protein [Moraxellaceae bacterium]
MAEPLRRDGDDVILVIHAQPGARQSEFAGLHGEALKVRLAAPAQEGKANRELCRFLAAAFGVPLASVTLLNGESSRHKRVKISSPRLWPPALAAWQ